MNKKGQLQATNLIVYGVVLLVIMGLGVILALAGSTVIEVTEGIVPGLTSLPETENVDLGGVTDTALTPWTTIVNSLPWILGGLYMVALIGMLGMAVAYKITGQKYLIAFYFLILIMVVLGAVLISNTYQDFYERPNAIGDNLKDMVLLSWLLLYSPLVMIIIGFIGGAIIFSGFEEVQT